jgi:multimeric flavodoxin WrbA
MKNSDRKKRKAGSGTLLIFQGSGRKGGNTDILCREAARGAREAGLQPRIVRLAGLRIAPCLGCFRCEDGQCRGRRDDMNALLRDMAGAESYIFATPVYFWNVSGLMKMFFDRLLPLLVMRREGNRIRLESRVAGRRAAVLVVQEEEEGPHESIPLLFFKRNFVDFGLTFSGRVMAFGALHAGDIKKNRKALAEARALGRDFGKSGQSTDQSARKS